tara:strand:+ start:82 stop:252 length:171 start_codon:yes stop_codon:yes gene_type:complete
MNEAAFPNPNRTDQTGMTLRDYFAAMVMEKCPLNNHTDAASWCYARADAMLKERGE